ncbi:MAG: hypothetical protein KF851_19300 [Pirellulaceae bacterium]|jgi:hypothetical protein|nr:hypothetical protein [Pirellulaceae bacterium]
MPHLESLSKFAELSMLESLRETWAKVQEIREARMVIWFSVLAVVILVGVYIMKAIRNAMLVPEISKTDHMAVFRELRDQGKLDDSEYQKLKQAVIPVGKRPEPVEFQELDRNKDNAEATRDD